MTFVMEAQQRAEQLRVPLVVVVAETHEDGRKLVLEQRLIDSGMCVVLCVPKTAAQDFQQLTMASQSSVCPRIHIFPPRAAVNVQPICLQGPTLGSARAMLLMAAQVLPETEEVGNVLSATKAAGSAWGRVQSERRNIASGPAAAAAAGSPLAGARQASPVMPDSGAPLPNNRNSGSGAAAAAAASASFVSQDDASAPPAAHIRLAPKCHIRIHPRAGCPTPLAFVAPQPRTKPLPEIRQAIAAANAATFGNNFLFTNGESHVTISSDNERRLIGLDVIHGETIFIYPMASLHIPVVHTATAATAATPAAAAPSSSASVTKNADAAASNAASKPVAAAPAAATPTTTATAAAAAGQIRMKITYPDDSNEVISFSGTDTANKVMDHVQQKVGHRNFFLQPPKGRIRDEQLDLPLSQLIDGRSVAIRVYDIEANKDRAAEYDAQQQQQSNLSSMLSGAKSMLFGGNSKGDGAAPPPPPSADGGARGSAGGDRPPPTSSSSGPRSMADIRRQQDEEEERRKKSGRNQFFNGSGTNTEAPPDDKK